MTGIDSRPSPPTDIRLPCWPSSQQARRFSSSDPGGRGGFASLVLGSVSQSVAHAGGSPLVIVHSAG